jgi:hypothetical protein
VPPEFELTQRSENCDRAAVWSPDGGLLDVWGINVVEGDFRSQIEEQIRRDEKEGWQFTCGRLMREWASCSGIKDDQIRYVRAIERLPCAAIVPLCF